MPSYDWRWQYKLEERKDKMDDFNAELLASQEARENRQFVDEVLRGATEEYHEGKQQPLCPDCGCTKGLGDDCERCHTSDDRYLLHGVLARLMAVYTSPEREWWDDSAGINEYDTAVEGLISTLTSYLSQG